MHLIWTILIGFVAKGAWDLVDESLLFNATDISLLRTPLAIPQGLWAFGLIVFLLLILASVALTAWRSQARIEAWRSSLHITVYPIAADDAPAACHALAREVARGLDYAHRLRDADGHPLQVVHRDISPQNVLVGIDGVARLADFGVATSTSSCAVARTAARQRDSNDKREKDFMERRV